MQEKFRRFISPDKIQKDYLCYSDSMGFDSDPAFMIERRSYNNYMIMYTVKGLLWCHQNDKKIAVYPGEYVFLDLHRPHKYYFQQGTPTLIAWLAINGAPAVQVVKYMEQVCEMPVKIKNETMYERLLEFYESADCPNPDIYKQSDACYSILMMILEENARPMGDVSLTNRQQEFKTEVWHLISHNIHRNITVEELAEAVSLSKYHFIRTFHDCFGISPHQFIMKEKIRQAEYQLLNTSATSSEIAESLGFSTPSYFAQVFRKITGASPSEYRYEKRS